MNLDEINIEIIDLKESPKSRFKALLFQPSWDKEDWEEVDGLFFNINRSKIENFINKALTEALDAKVDCIIFPELSIPEDFLNVIKVWTIQNNTIVIAGSHYKKDENSYINICPIIYKGKIYNSDKINPSPLELSPIGGDGVNSGKSIKVFKNSPIGDFGVLICADYLSSPLTNKLLEVHTLDTLIVPAFQKDSSIYQNKMEVECRSSENGIYIIYANNLMLNAGDGKSSVFGLMHRDFFKKLIGYSTDGRHQTMIAEFNNDTLTMIIDFSLKEKKPSLAKTIESTPNIQVFLTNKDKILSKSKTQFDTGITDSHLENIYSYAKSIIATHGLDDAEWIKALSSQYFLKEIAKIQGMDETEEFNNVVDAFLDFFSLKHDDSIILKNERILVTPDETEKLKVCMIEEDKADSYFTVSAKTKAENINTQQLHENYLYGVALGISSNTRHKHLKAVQDLALDYLLYKKNPPSKDNHGGWYPYRIPWITARILISLSKINLNDRDDKQNILEVIDRSLESLISRLTPNNIWRSGVGDWVSNTESTALCLESFLECDNSFKYKLLLEPIILKNLKNLDIAETNADFSTEITSNETLANTIMSSVCLRFINKYELHQHIEEKHITNHLNYCIKVLSKIKEFKDSQPRQFCTIPQIVAYCLKITF